MKKKIAALLSAAVMLTAVPAFAATDDANTQNPGWSMQQRLELSDKDAQNNDGWYCGRGRGHGYGRHGGCWNNQQQ
ncbi:hypothetical protein SELR_pSRC101510 (plasmid) [Selenomonas ruminantium subsp. lactilytica TAM6421]|jgi:hypothetical protein|uniref:Uncharacterized protein n=1 Tax=Selenomonas ruminantium subsp. lactilytica (strain NBRC 103574 / TAM6421) TaxID=927704 RepID=I0GW21_SELRL|nr:hypothetical protein [Selenomonas ruminantium]BAL84958.1 hypothetical protein SELR_pSRC101510 [Selenomonas ruminantium subsp. lactilytica TAM6421]